MNLFNSSQPPKREWKARIYYDLVAFGLAAIGVGSAGIFLFSPAGDPLRASLASLFALGWLSGRRKISLPCFTETRFHNSVRHALERLYWRSNGR